MLNILKLLLPALIPSWKFFKAIEPSPRVQWRVMSDPARPKDEWRDFRRRPAHLSPMTILQRIFWNPQWNETLFLVSLSERMVLNPRPHSSREIFRRLNDEINAGQLAEPRFTHLQFRLIFVRREGESVVEETAFVSDTCRRADIA